MTKYIDLLREHQPDVNKEKRSSQTTANPYSQKPEDDDQAFADIDILLEEQETPDAPLSLYAQEDPMAASWADEPQIPTPSHTGHGFDLHTWLKHIEQHLAQIFSAVHHDKPFNIHALHKQLEVLFDQIQTSPKVIDALELEINLHLQSNLNTMHHADLVQKSILMMLYTIKLGQELQLQFQELLSYTIAAMLHHLGMAMVPTDIRQKPDKLSNDEWQRIKQAPQQALHYLRKHHIQHEQLALALQQGAERYDGSGPLQLKGHDIAWVARLVSLLSMFEALIHIRPYRQRLLPRDAIREIVKRHKKEFDPKILKALIESISLYPVGTFVQLNTGEIGQVVGVHNKFPLRPIVHIHLNKQGQEIAERKIDLKKQPNLMIQKCMYEESIAELTQA